MNFDTEDVARANMAALHFVDMRLEGVRSISGENYLLLQWLLRLTEDGDAPPLDSHQDLKKLVDIATQACALADKANAIFWTLINTQKRYEDDSI